MRLRPYKACDFTEIDLSKPSEFSKTLTWGASESHLCKPSNFIFRFPVWGGPELSLYHTTEKRSCRQVNMLCCIFLEIRKTKSVNDNIVCLSLFLFFGSSTVSATSAGPH